MSTEILADADALAAAIPDGTRLAIFKDGGVPMAAIRALVRRGARDLHLVTVPTSGLAADLLIGAGCVATIETAGVSLGEFGAAPCFTRAVKAGGVAIRDTTCPAVYAGLQAAEKGVPFMPLRGLIGSDILRVRPDYRVIDNPFGTDDPIVVLPAIAPDVALIHVALADRFGTVWIGRQGELKIMAHAARRTLVTAERIVDEPIAEDDLLAAASISSLYVEAVAPAWHGAWPLEMPGEYGVDREHIADYARRAGTPGGMADYLAETVHGRARAAE
jgi:glutaconate CoA-transferase subunit A